MKELVLIAVDSNVLLDQADGNADVIDALAIIRRRLPDVRLIVTPTVLEELGFALDDEDSRVADLAQRALESLFEWGYEPLNLILAGKGIAQQIGIKFRIRGVFPDEEVNDSEIVAEAALIGCEILLSSDSHMMDAQNHRSFREILKEADVENESIVIARPRIIATRFFQR